MGFSILRAAMDYFLLFYYTDVAGINPAMAGGALLVGKLTWDAINDPLFGYWSDRTRSRFGRRRIYMLLAAAPIAIATWIQFSLPYGMTGIGAFLAVLLTFWLKDTFITMAVVPYYAMAPELTRDYQERSSVATFRGVASVIGYILGGAGTMLLAGIYKGAGLNLQLAWSATGATYGLVAMVLLLVTTLTVKERPELAGEPSRLPPVKAILLCFKNRPFVILTIVYMLGIFAFTVQAAVFPYLLQYQLNMAGQIPAVMAVAMATIGIFLIPAKWVADKINKGPAYALGLFITATAFILAFFFLPQSNTPWVYLVAVIVGIGFSAQWIFPFAMLPDVIEHDEKMTGERREGIYYGISNFMTKFSMALGIAVTGWALSWYGYVPNAVQTENALFGIRFFYAVVPATVLFICLPFLIRYPITQKSHTSLGQELADEKAALIKSYAIVGEGGVGGEVCVRGW